MRTVRERWSDAVALALGLPLAVAVFVLPLPLTELVAGGQDLGVRAMTERVGRGIDAWFTSGSADPAADLDHTVALWSLFHGVKATLAGIALACLLPVALRGLAWHRPRWWTRLADTAVRGLCVVLTVVVVATVQGAAAPLSSAISLLPAGAQPELAGVIAETGSGGAAPVAQRLIDDSRLYHATAAVGLAIVLVTILGVGRAAARSARSDGRPRRRRLAVSSATAAAALTCGVLLAANVSTTIDPAPALVAWLGAGS